MCALENAPPISGASFEAANIAVIVADGDPSMRSILRQMLSQIGIVTCQDVGSGAAALALLDGGYIPEIVICCTEMNPMDGMELGNAMRRHKNALVRNVPVILLSNQEADPLLADVASQIGIAEILVKPVSANQLARCMASMIGIVPN